MSASKRKQLEARLDGRQRVAALACVEREFAAESERQTFDEIAAAAGVTRNTLYEWRTQNRAMWTATQQWQPGWLASQADVLAEDWTVVE